MKAVADTLAVARSNLIERVSRRAKSRRTYRKAGDDELLALIRRLVDERPYRYRLIRSPAYRVPRRGALRYRALSSHTTAQFAKGVIVRFSAHARSTTLASIVRS